MEFGLSAEEHLEAYQRDFFQCSTKQSPSKKEAEIVHAGDGMRSLICEESGRGLTQKQTESSETEREEG